jgi:hypothetical protein
MRALEFKQSIINNRKLAEFVKSVFNKNYPEEKFLYYYIFDNKIMVHTESEMNFNITSLISKEIVQNDFIF